MALKSGFPDTSVKNILQIKHINMKIIKKMKENDKKLVKEISLGLGKIMLFHMVNRLLKKYGLPTIVIKMLENGLAQLALSSPEKLISDDLKADDLIVLLHRLPIHEQDYIIKQLTNLNN